MKKIINKRESSDSSLNRNIKGMNEFLSSKKGAAFLIAMFFMIIVITVFGGTNWGATGNAESNDVEKRLAAIISKAKDVEQAEVMITYEKAESAAASGEIFIFGNEKKLNAQETNGEIRGVIVAAKGADDYSVKIEIINIVKTALNVPASKIEIVNMK